MDYYAPDMIQYAELVEPPHTMLMDDEHAYEPVIHKIHTISGVAVHTQYVPNFMADEFYITWYHNAELRKSQTMTVMSTWDQAELTKSAFMMIARSICKQNNYPSTVEGWFVNVLSAGNAKIVKSMQYNLAPTPNPNIEKLARNLPGVQEMVKSPCCGTTDSLLRTVIHLNDFHKWTREKIADWLDLLAERDGIDLTFKV